MKKIELKKQILESMKILVSEGQTLSSKNNDDFYEFAEINNYPLDLVKEVYYSNEEYLMNLYLKLL